MFKPMGKPDISQNNGKEKNNFDWARNWDGIIFTVYDWKEYRKINQDDIIEWHIGGFSKDETEKVKNKIKSLI